MITRTTRWRSVDLKLRARSVRSYQEARAIFEALYREARRLGVLPTRDRLQGFDVDVRLAAALNRLRTSHPAPARRARR